MKYNYDDEIKKIFENKKNKKYNNEIINNNNKKEHLNNKLLKKKNENIININNYNDNQFDLKTIELINKLKNIDKKEKKKQI